MPTIRFSRACLAITLAAGLTYPALAEDKAITTGLMFWNARREGNDVLSSVKFNKLINDNLADAQQANLYIDACYSGTLIGLSSDAKNKLTMPFVLGTSDDGTTKSTDIWSRKDLDPARRLKGSDDFYYGGYSPYLAKHLQGAAPKVKDLHDSAKADVVADPDRRYREVPQFTKGNGADDQLKINAGTNKKHAIVFGGDLSSLKVQPIREMWKALDGKGYDSLKFYQHSYSAQTFEGVTFDGPGTFANFKSELERLKTSTTADKGKQTVSLFLETHGVRDTKDFKYQVGAIPNAPKQGEAFVGAGGGGGGPTGSLGLLMDDVFWSDLKEDLVTDDPDQIRAVQPRFYLAYSEAAFAVDSTMSITLGGVNLGDFNLETTSTGGLLEANLSDSTLLQIIALNDGAPQLDVTFSLDDGDFFRLATDNDILFDPLYTQLNYGAGLISGVQGVPAPASLALLMTSLGLTARRRRANS